MPIRDLLERDELIFGKKIELMHTFRKVQGFVLFCSVSLEVNFNHANKMGQCLA